MGVPCTLAPQVKHLSRPAAGLPGCGAQLLPGLDEATRSRVYVFNAFFLKRLRTNLLKGKDLTPLLKWVKDVDLFQKVGVPQRREQRLSDVHATVALTMC